LRPGSSLLKLTAVVLVSVLVLTLAAPARAEADALLLVGLAGVAVIVVIVVVYLVVASSRGPKMPAEAQPVMVACVESDVDARNCWPAPSAPAVPQVLAPAPSPELVPQS
jgi:hypothetical protein